MYKVCRAIIAISVIELIYAFTLVMLAGFPWSLFALLGAIGFRTYKKGRAYWAHGTSRWASERELRRAGMIEGDRGLVVGRLAEAQPPRFWQVIQPLFNPRVGPKAACDQFLRLWSPSKKGQRVRLANAVHTAVFAPTGVGKSAGLIIPQLLECNEGSVVCIDPKGELAAITAKHRRKRFGHEIVMLDPWRLVTQEPDSLNPLSIIDRESDEAIDECRDLAEMLVVKTGEEKEPHWNEAAEMWIAAVAAAVVLHGDPNDRSLQTVCDILSKPHRVKEIVDGLCSSDGLLARLGGQLAHFVDKELASTLTSVNRHLRPFSTPAVIESTSSSSFDPAELRKGKHTIYLILPTEHMRAQMGLLRMWIGTLMRSVIRGGVQHV